MSSWNELIVPSGAEEPHRPGLSGKTTPGLRLYADIGADGLTRLDSIAESCLRQLLPQMATGKGHGHEMN